MIAEITCGSWEECIYNREAEQPNPSELDRFGLGRWAELRASRGERKRRRIAEDGTSAAAAASCCYWRLAPRPEPEPAVSRSRRHRLSPGSRLPWDSATFSLRLWIFPNKLVTQNGKRKRGRLGVVLQGANNNKIKRTCIHD